MIIYKTTNLINGKFYVGKDMHNNSKYLGSGCLLKYAIRKYGIKNFKKEIIEFCSSKEELNEREKFWIENLGANKKDRGYNITIGGTGGDTFSNNPNKEIIRDNHKKSAILSNNKIEVINKHRINTTNLWKIKNYRDKVLENQKKKRQTEEYKLKQSLAAKNIKHTPDWNRKVGKNNIIRFHIKKIKYFLKNGMNMNIISNYFNTDINKIDETLKIEGFIKEPNIEILLEAFEMHKNGLKTNKIYKKIKVAKLQLKTFFELMFLQQIK